MDKFAKKDIIYYYIAFGIILVFIILFCAVISYNNRRLLENFNSHNTDLILNQFSDDAKIIYNNKNYNFIDYKDAIKQKMDSHKIYMNIDKADVTRMKVSFYNNISYSTSCTYMTNFMHTKIKNVFLSNPYEEYVFLDTITPYNITYTNLNVPITDNNLGFGSETKNVKIYRKDFDTIISFDYPKDSLFFDKFALINSDYIKENEVQLYDAIQQNNDFVNIYRAVLSNTTYYEGHDIAIDVRNLYITVSDNSCKVYLCLYGAYDYTANY